MPVRVLATLLALCLALTSSGGGRGGGFNSLPLLSHVPSVVGRLDPKPSIPPPTASIHRPHLSPVTSSPSTPGVGSAGPPGGPAPHAGSPVAPTYGLLLGAFVNYLQTHNQSIQQSEVPTFESEIGRHLAIDHHYYAWDEPFPRGWDRWDVSAGRIPMISWTCGNTATIAAGGYDSLIAQRADDVKTFGSPVFIRWFWEMGLLASQHDLDCLRGGAAGYVAAYRHIWQIFNDHGVTNVAWVWCPEQSAFPGKDLAYYPGDQYVDWVCADGYSRTAASVPFATIFAAFYSEWGNSGKPLMIGETGALAGASQGDWVRQMAVTLKTRYRAIKAVVYWDAIGNFDYVLEGSSGLAGFAEVGRDPYFTAR